MKFEDKYSKLHLQEENKNETFNPQDIVFSSNQLDYNYDYKYSKAKIINDNDNNSNKLTDAIKEKIDESRKTIVEAVAVNNNNSTELKEKNAEIKIIKENNNFDEDFVYRKNITIENFEEAEKLQHDLKLLKFDFLNKLNIKNYLKKNKLLKLNLNLNFRNNESFTNSTHSLSINQTNQKKEVIIGKNHTILNISHPINNININANIRNSTHLEKKIKDFISQKIMNKSLNVSSIHNISEIQIKRILSDFHAKEKNIFHNILKDRKNNDFKFNKSTNKTKSLNRNKTQEDFSKTKHMISQNIDKISEKLTTIFKKVLKDLLDDLNIHEIDSKIEHNISEIKNEIRESLSQPLNNTNNIINKNDHIKNITILPKSEFQKKIQQNIKIIKHLNNSSSSKYVGALKNLTDSIPRNTVPEINFLQKKVSKVAKLNSFKKKVSKVAKVNSLKKNSLTNNSKKSIENKKEIHNLPVAKKEIILKKWEEKVSNTMKNDFINKQIRFEFENSFSKMVPHQTNSEKAFQNFNKNKREEEIQKKSLHHIKEKIKKIKILKTLPETKIYKNIEIHNKTLTPPIKSNLKNLKNSSKLINHKNKTIEHNNSTSNSIIEIEKKIISQLPLLKEFIEKINIIDNKKNFSQLNKTDIKLEINNKKIFESNHEIKKLIYMNNNNLTVQNKTNSSIIEKNFTKIVSEKKIEADKNSSIIKQEIKVELIKIKEEDKKINITSNITKGNNSTKLNEKKLKSEPIKEKEKKSKNLGKKKNKEIVDLEVDDNSMMAEILRAYKNKFKNKSS